MNPPLRTREDVASLKASLADGTIDAIATDHAPHGKHDKEVEFDKAAFGIIGLETMLGLSIMELIEQDILDWSALIERMSLRPAKILGIKGGHLSKSAPADITIIDPEREWVFGETPIVSKSKNSPFIGWRLKGSVTEVFVNGKPLLRDGTLSL
jgi:dihydroorotase